MSGGTLEDRINSSTLTSKKAWKVAFEVARAMAFLHSCRPPVIHGDLRPENILFDAHGRAKVSDFRLGKYVDQNKNLREFKRQVALDGAKFLAPEVITSFESTLESDVYAYGVIISEMFQGSTSRARPLPTNEEYLRRALSGGGPDPSITSRVKDGRALKIISGCIRKVPSERSSFAEMSEALEARSSQKANCSVM
mmetsp:Transcript_18367/g.34681  ORF Transcript_18367/g.34681 Transcript_18367/m.34681 type:complete len:196 (-) Transcript_18367:611-1198(-)